MNSASESTGNTTLVNCPRCGDLFRLPRGIRAEAVMVCPHCQADFPVVEVMDDIPVAEVSGNGSRFESAGATEAPAPAVNVAAGSQPKHAIDSGDFSIPKPLKTAERSRRRSHSSRRSQNSHPINRRKTGIGEWLKVVLGAVLAIPIAQLILWWVFAADPLHLAASVSRVAPALVPPALRPTDPAEPGPGQGFDLDMPPGQILNDDDRPPFRTR